MTNTVPVQKNEVIEVNVTDLTYEGLGVAKVEHFPIFIENALPNEKVEIKVIKVKKNFAFGKLEKILQSSPDRINNIDKRYINTGIAPLSHLSYPKQLEYKSKQVIDLFDKTDLKVDVLPTIGMDKPYQYRNKAQIPVRNIKGQLETGFYRRHSHDLIPIEDFYIQEPVIDDAILKVRDILRKYQIMPYDEISHKGIMRNIMVRVGHYSRELMIVLVVNSNKLPYQDEIVNDIKIEFPEIKSIIKNVNYTKGNKLLGSKNEILFGSKYITDNLLDNQYKISPMSFYQINPVQTEKIYELVKQKANLSKDDIVIDAYSGIGTITLTLAKDVKEIYGVEVVEDAINDAKLNAKLNNINNAHFVVGKAEEQMEKWKEDGLKPDVVVVDPPRKGLDQQFISSMVEMNPKKIIYVSCNPSTLVRDAIILNEQGYSINEPVQPVDQFPQTTHVESITIFEK
ncbi:23S rRNA (uracil(1939)-C(5))-methyltransferase RlmD [Lactobacillus sp. S2-2]|uniref:23S rRNA (uracil(1939)-C(5))-methyltransferase RlmD n=1 Tax=Lactobacillus sp. S2-2 TaxID=2692917 RepID=UPI001F006774|nr:23S rRNA (uracil(1939)-C(5))-methyltransferase RlmD [Lactobacillus sp. S2-2]MCF6514810.1 23S rRNA (uracil(1939)-C(5))-methyltransferase RlmD [Lactobacillus sp. S2-2]